jgi:DNA excision repair protein ERCC-2
MCEFDPEIYCPYPCYPAQKVIMQEIFAALTAERIYLLEGACGTGKTLSALIPAISVAKSLKKLVVIATNVNEQKKQFITEAISIREKAQINIIVMSSKLNICYQNNVPNKAAETDYNACEKIRDAGECEPYNRVKGLTSNEDEGGKGADKEAAKEAAVLLGVAFETWLFSSVRAPDEIAAWGVEHNSCAYTLVWKALSRADVVICDLRIVLDKRFMHIFEFFTGKSLKDMIIIFDEAHNIEKAAKDVYKQGVSENTLRKGLAEIDTILGLMREGHDLGLDMYQLEKSRVFFQSVLMDSLMELKIPENDTQKATHSYDDSEIRIADPEKPYYERPDEFTDLIISRVETVGGEQYVRTNLDLLSEIGLKYQDACKKSDPEHNSTSKCTTIAEFFREYLDIPNQNGYYPYLSVRKNQYGAILRRVSIHLSLPDIITAPVLNEVFAGVLMSATLEPFDTLKKILGISREQDPIEHTVGLQFPRHNRRTYVVTRDARNDRLAGAQPQKHAPDRLVSTNDFNPASERYIQDSLEAVIDGANSNVLIFFKTKAQALQYYPWLRGKYGERLLLNDASHSSGEVKDIFFKMGADGKQAILCTYLGGSLTEGVDFKGDRARVVVVVGIGYTYRSLLIEADETAYRIKFKKDVGWNYVVQIPTIHKVRQAMGRVIRNDEDYGIRVLLDARYYKNTTGSVAKLFPPEERREFVEVKTQYLKEIIAKDFKSFRNSPEK